MSWDIAGNSGTDPSVNFLGTTDEQPLVVKTNGQEVLRFDSTGQIGIGTPNPSSKLEIAAQDGLQIHGYQPFLTLKDSNSNDAQVRIQTVNGEINFQTAAGIASGSGIPAMKILNSGTVQIVSQDALQLIGYQPFLSLIDSNSGYAPARIQTVNGEINFQTAAGIASRSGIPAMKILNSGDVEFAGDVRLTNADCAEDFDIICIEKVEPGTVMVIDSEGALRPSDQAYDKRVAGVVSGAGKYKPGLILDKQESSKNRMPIALIGKVYCKVDASYGAISVGDLLTTSPTIGYAMKADDPLKAFGAVIGKALQPLAEGKGLVPILIALQ